MSENKKYKKIIKENVEEISEKLIEISDWLYENPEYGCEEFEASELLSKELEKNGFQVEKPFLNMPTAFKGTYKGKPGGPKIAILGEYDALEGIGHGCGHNIIGTAAIGAGIALSKILNDLKGEVIVLGCPAEENRKGGPPGGWPCQFSKLAMSAQGVFNNIDAAIMVHPTTGLSRIWSTTLISQYVDVIFKGKSAHAAGNPWDGRNALQSAVLFINGVNAIRQQLRRGSPYYPVIHFILTEGGTAMNAIPEISHVYGGCRSQDREYMNEMFKMIHNCAKGAAIMMGCELEWTPRSRGALFAPPGSEKREVKIPNLYLTELVYENMLKLKVDVEDWRISVHRPPGGGTDFGNVTHKVPALDISISISKEKLPGHSEQFAKATTSDEGHFALINGVNAMAMTAVDVFTVPEHVEKMKAVHLKLIDEYKMTMEEIGYVQKGKSF
jgi:amidohydrolase